MPRVNFPHIVNFYRDKIFFYFYQLSCTVQVAYKLYTCMQFLASMKML
jgi:hypothetical protein